jgi:hypothetical protein
VGKCKPRVAHRRRYQSPVLTKLATQAPKLATWHCRVTARVGTGRSGAIASKTALALGSIVGKAGRGKAEGWKADREGKGRQRDRQAVKRKQYSGRRTAATTVLDDHCCVVGGAIARVPACRPLSACMPSRCQGADQPNHDKALLRPRPGWRRM